MKRSRRGVLLAVLLCLALAPCVWAAMPKAAQGRVGDFAGILSDETKPRIIALIAATEKTTGAEIAVVTITSLEGMSVEEYAVTLFKAWGIGKKGRDNGVLLLVAPNERKVWIEVGYGLEPVITDGQAGAIIRETVLPFFKAGDYDQGILQGSTQIAALITGKAFVPSVSIPRSESELHAEPLAVKMGVMLFFALFITIGFLALGSALRKKGQGFLRIWGAGFGGIPLGMSLVFASVMGFSMYILPAWALFVLIVGSSFGKRLFNTALSSGVSVSVGGRRYYSGGSSSGSSGGSSFGGFSGGSSFGGFGGGSSGGGGAGGSW